jgi:glycosyltransferase involved in cell wall biosynthesis
MYHFAFVVNPEAPQIPGFDRPIRVLWLIKGLGPGGAERLVVSSARQRSDHIHAEVAFLLPHKQALVPELEALGVQPVCLGSARALDPRWLLRLRRRLRDAPVDIVHVHSPVAAVGARIVVRSLRRSEGRPRLVSTEHNVWSSHNRLTRIANAATSALDDAHLAVSNAVRDSMPRHLRSRTRVIQYGVELQRVRSARSARRSIREELGIDDDHLVIGTVANLRATKGYPDLLMAAKLVADQDDNVSFVAVGQGPMEAELHERHRALGLGNRFRFLGYRADACEVMAAFDIFCLASHHEGLPIALMEAMVLGLPSVATRVGGNAEIIADGDTGILVPPRQPGALAEALLALARDPDRRATMAPAASHRGDELGVEVAIGEIEKIYEQLVR